MKRINRIFSVILALTMLACCMPMIASAESKLDGLTIVAFGDSLTEGTLWWENNNLDTYPDILQRNFPNSTVKNAGSRGDSTYNALFRYKTDVIAHNPDIVIMCFGMNDQAWEIEYGRPIQTLERYRVQLVEMLRACQDIGADVIFVTPNPVFEEAYKANEYNNYEYGLMDDYCNEMREIALEYGCGLVDINYEIKTRGISTYVGSDGIHQTAAGHSLYAECITNYLNAAYDGVNAAKATVNYKNKNGDIIGKCEYIGAAGANITLATPSHLGCAAVSEDIKTALKDGDVFEMTFENEMILSRNKKYTATAPNRGDGNIVNDDGLRLVDGLKSNLDPGTNFYSGWNKTEQGFVEVTVDLGEAKKSNVYRVYGANGHWGISQLNKISVAVSNDAVNFGEEIAICAEKVKLCDGKTVDGKATTMYSITANPTQTQNARYIRFRIYPSAGNAFVWIDEVEVIYDASLESPVVEPETKVYALGDINMDNAVNQYDYILAKRAHFNTVTLNDNQKLLGDMDENGKNNQYDYILVKRIHFKNFSTDKTVEVVVE